eukprot:TRINITY_DN47389_c0_g1_i1.p3 TRINITY_DN47389_c0_g1~~TRINITY_DN47389_c0_g1_i1.p3  ORF type:complete len:108 (+),score=6.32 TRINITY_DN47389_c0_g1_i1:29-352(+)
MKKVLPVGQDLQMYLFELLHINSCPYRCGQQKYQKQQKKVLNDFIVIINCFIIVCTKCRNYFLSCKSIFLELMKCQRLNSIGVFVWRYSEIRQFELFLINYQKNIII